MTCGDIEARLTAYLDGELDATTSSALRGHLRTCPACNQLAEDHARVAGALAALHDRPLDPPPALWDGVLARLAEAEKVDAKRSWWSLVVQRAWQGLRPQLLPVTAVAAAAVVALVWWSRHDAPRGATRAEIVPPIAEDPVGPELAPPALPDPVPELPKADVEAALANEAHRIDALYADVVADLTTDALDERTTWPAPRQRAFDAELVRLRAAVQARPLVTDAPVLGLDPDGDYGVREARERAWQRLVTFLQRAAVGDLLAEAR